ncbi:MAG: M14 family zinc carboxypeptidase, partial [Chitinophagaceae bacterium]
MKAFLFSLAFLGFFTMADAKHLITPFELSKGQSTATYYECIDFYKKLETATGRVRVDSSGQTDAGFPLHTIIYPATKKWDTSGITIVINNGIHPGEPDGIDASMMLLRDLAEGLYSIPKNVRLVVIPIYNIGGALNRNNSTRVNQDGPLEYGFRGNSQNLDLNRDFIKNDSRNARIFRQIFHRYDPEIFIDNHVSDGADYQHTMTLLSTQYDKLGGALGEYFRNTLDPLLYKKMDAAGWPMIPYVNVEDGIPDSGWTAFYDP